ncbi:MAG: hypothetical protein WCJ40_21400 [Planctomycetota bacterium]
MEETTASNYIKDLGQLIKEKALDAKTKSQVSSDTYDIGFLMAWHDIVSLMQTQAVAFGIPYEEIGLSGIDPDVDLL